MTTEATETKTRWERHEGWDGTWADIFEEMGWDPAKIWSIGVEGSYVAWDMIQEELDVLSFEVTVEDSGKSLYVQKEVVDGFVGADSIRAVTYDPDFDGELILYPTREYLERIWEREHAWERSMRKRRRAREKAAAQSE